MEINNQWQEAFRTDLRNNLSRISNGFEKQLYLGDFGTHVIYAWSIIIKVLSKASFLVP